MAIKYATVLVKNPKTKQKEVRARAVNDEFTLDQVCKRVAAESTMSKADVKGVLEACFCTAVEQVKNGYAVRLGVLGTLYPALKSEASKKEDSFNAAMITKAYCRYRPSKEVKAEMADFEVVKTITKKEAAEAAKTATTAQNAALHEQAQS